MKGDFLTTLAMSVNLIFGHYMLPTLLLITYEMSAQLAEITVTSQSPMILGSLFRVDLILTGGAVVPPTLRCGAAYLRSAQIFQSMFLLRPFHIDRPKNVIQASQSRCASHFTCASRFTCGPSSRVVPVHVLSQFTCHPSSRVRPSPRRGSG
jgi:hypothetical protein